ncbi:hypothetical protein [Phaeobacter phage MD18]|nr:hypothetical protein [Phaeobacter phage MD18]
MKSLEKAHIESMETGMSARDKSYLDTLIDYYEGRPRRERRAFLSNLRAAERQYVRKKKRHQK